MSEQQHTEQPDNTRALRANLIKSVEDCMCPHGWLSVFTCTRAKLCDCGIKQSIDAVRTQI